MRFVNAARAAREVKFKGRGLVGELDDAISREKVAFSPRQFQAAQSDALDIVLNSPGTQRSKSVSSSMRVRGWIS